MVGYPMVVALVRSDTSTMSANNKTFHLLFRKHKSVIYLQGKGFNCCAKKPCEIFKGEKINLLSTQSSKNVCYHYLFETIEFFVHLMVSPELERE